MFLASSKFLARKNFSILEVQYTSFHFFNNITGSLRNGVFSITQKEFCFHCDKAILLLLPNVRLRVHPSSAAHSPGQKTAAEHRKTPPTQKLETSETEKFFRACFFIFWYKKKLLLHRLITHLFCNSSLILATVTKYPSKASMIT